MKKADDYMRTTCMRVFVGLSIIVLASCRLVITIDETGHIVSASGSMDCTEASCEFPVEEKLTETFTAIPAEGYRFVRWKGVCLPFPSEICHATVSPLPEILQDYDGDIFLSAVFESSSEMRPWFRDEDGDQYGTPTESLMAYERPEGFSINDKDCADDDADIRPREVDPGVCEAPLEHTRSTRLHHMG
jgi:hypothetical protein